MPERRSLVERVEDLVGVVDASAAEMADEHGRTVYDTALEIAHQQPGKAETALDIAVTHWLAQIAMAGGFPADHPYFSSAYRNLYGDRLEDLRTFQQGELAVLDQTDPSRQKQN